MARLPRSDEKKMQTGACTSICMRSSYLPGRVLPRPTGATVQLPKPPHPLELLGVHLSVTPKVGALPPDSCSLAVRRRPVNGFCGENLPFPNIRGQVDRCPVIGRVPRGL